MEVRTENRREFLQTTAAAALLAATGLSVRAWNTGGNPINAKLSEITQTLRATKFIRNVEPYLVEHPTVGLVQWRWPHFSNDPPDDYLDEVEKSNFAIPNKQLKQLIDYEVARRENIFIAMPQRPNSDGGGPLSLNISPLARLGAGYFLHQQRGVKILATEDPVIDVEAERAIRLEESDPEYMKWVHNERNKHFISVVRESNRDLVHFLVGRSHNLRPEIEKSNKAGPEQISHIVITATSSA